MNDRQWRVQIERRAERSLRRLPKPLLARIRSAIGGLGEDPRPHGYRKLKGFENLYRIRVGEWRVVYAIEEEMLIILIVEISPRGDAYRDL